MTLLECGVSELKELIVKSSKECNYLKKEKESRVGNVVGNSIINIEIQSSILNFLISGRVVEKSHA